jgi:hypothetical protein
VARNDRELGGEEDHGEQGMTLILKDLKRKQGNMELNH